MNQIVTFKFTIADANWHSFSSLISGLPELIRRIQIKPVNLDTDFLIRSVEDGDEIKIKAGCAFDTDFLAGCGKFQSFEIKTASNYDGSYMI